tara:strand:+ start:80 stop:721 length:642 start_codon:yes stop_codon:yes gene_type:complete
MNWRDSLDAAKARLLTIQSSTGKLPLQARSVVYGAAAVFAVVTLVTLSNVLGWWLGSFSDISATKPRISRLLGYIEAAPQIESAAAEIDLALARVAIEDTGDTGRGGALLQQQLRQLAGNIGLTVVGSEVKEPVQLEALVKLNATLQVTGGPDDFDEFFQSLYRASPALFPEGMQAEALRRINRRLRNPDAATADHLSARIDVSAYRLSEPND